MEHVMGSILRVFGVLVALSSVAGAITGQTHYGESSILFALGFVVMGLGEIVTLLAKQTPAQPRPRATSMSYVDPRELREVR
jgi:uncharacterized membrane protein YczE